MAENAIDQPWLYDNCAASAFITPAYRPFATFLQGCATKLIPVAPIQIPPLQHLYTSSLTLSDEPWFSGFS